MVKPQEKSSKCERMWAVAHMSNTQPFMENYGRDWRYTLGKCSRKSYMFTNGQLDIAVFPHGIYVCGKITEYSMVDLRNIGRLKLVGLKIVAENSVGFYRQVIFEPGDVKL